jgi:hypothetical protein
MSDFEERQTHPTFGMVGFHRQTGGNLNLFGSSLRHNNYIAMTVKTASKRRGLHQDWIHGVDTIVELILSPNQFADLLTTMNVGDGVPCTLSFLPGVGDLGACPEVQPRQIFEREFEADVRKVMTDAREIVREVSALFDAKANITKSDRASIIEKLRMLMQHIESNMPFVQSQFNESMDKTVTEARAEVEAFVSNKIASLGIQALEAEVAKALEGVKTTPALESK